LNLPVINRRRYWKIVLFQVVYQTHPLVKMKTDHNRQVLLLQKAAPYMVDAVLVARLEVPAESISR
jgi:hypothetical protein